MENQKPEIKIKEVKVTIHIPAIHNEKTTKEHMQRLGLRALKKTKKKCRVILPEYIQSFWFNIPQIIYDEFDWFWKKEPVIKVFWKDLQEGDLDADKDGIKIKHKVVNREVNATLAQIRKNSDSNLRNVTPLKEFQKGKKQLEEKTDEAN